MRTNYWLLDITVATYHLIDMSRNKSLTLGEDWVLMNSLRIDSACSPSATFYFSKVGKHGQVLIKHMEIYNGRHIYISKADEEEGFRLLYTLYRDTPNQTW